MFVIVCNINSKSDFCNHFTSTNFVGYTGLDVQLRKGGPDCAWAFSYAFTTVPACKWPAARKVQFKRNELGRGVICTVTSIPGVLTSEERRYKGRSLRNTNPLKHFHCRMQEIHLIVKCTRLYTYHTSVPLTVNQEIFV